MTKDSLLATGLNGLIGSKLASDLAHEYDFINMDRSDPQNPVDITQYDQVNRCIAASNASWVIHFAAFTDVTKAWEEAGDKTGIAWQVNVEGTRNIVKACQENQKHLLHLSTSYVFDGTKETAYLENDPASPIEWYGQTKAEAEAIVQTSDIPWVILRIDQPFRSDTYPRPDIVRKIVHGLKTHTLKPQFVDHTFGPTYIDDLVKVIRWIVQNNAEGILHASSGEKWTDYDFAHLVQETFQLEGKIEEGHLDEYLKTVNRPYQRNTALNCDKLKLQLDFPLKSIEMALREVHLES